MLSQGKVLIVDDESAIRRALRHTLQGMGFTVEEATTGEAARRLFGIALRCRPAGHQHARNRRNPRLPRGTEEPAAPGHSHADGARPRGRQGGRIRRRRGRLHHQAISLPRAGGAHTGRGARSSAFQPDPDATIRIGNIELDPSRRLVRKAGEPVHLTPKEFDLLSYLMAHAGLPITHARLLQKVWGPEYGGELEYLRTFVRQLRKKLEDDPAAARVSADRQPRGISLRRSQTGACPRENLTPATPPCSPTPRAVLRRPRYPLRGSRM